MTFIEQLTAALTCFNGVNGVVTFSGRTHDGIGEVQLQIPAPLSRAPLNMLRNVTAQYSFTMSPFTSEAGGLVAFPLVVVLWRLAHAFVKGADGVFQRVVTAEGQAAVAAALAKMPPPSIVVDAAHEQWAAWRLEEPLPDPIAAAALFRRLAEQLGGDTALLDPLSAMRVPIAGPIRNWNHCAREAIAIVVAAPERQYTVNDLEPKDRTSCSSSTSQPLTSKPSTALLNSTRTIANSARRTPLR